MTEPQIITILLSLVATFFGLLVIMSGWLGNKFYSLLQDMAKSMRTIETDLHGQISGLDKRVVILETKEAARE